MKMVLHFSVVADQVAWQPNSLIATPALPGREQQSTVGLQSTLPVQSPLGAVHPRLRPSLASSGPHRHCPVKIPVGAKGWRG